LNRIGVLSVCALMSVVDEWITKQLDLSNVVIPLGDGGIGKVARNVGVDALYPLVGMVAYIIMNKVLGPHGVSHMQVQSYNVFIIAVSAGILIPTLYFRISGFTSMQKAYCPSGESISPELRLCLWAYHVSKYAEYADTAFLILKGKKVTNLHYWHHLVVTLTSWMWLRSEIEWVADGVIFNTFVHCIMYYYYYLSAAGQAPWWKRYVTGLQITQFLSSFVATSIWAYFHSKVGCKLLKVIIVSVAFNGWLLVMFGMFYLENFKNKKKSN